MIQRLRLNSIPNPGANAARTLYDDSTSTSDELTHKARVEIALLSDVTVTLNTYWADAITSPLRLVATESLSTTSTHSTQPITVVAKANLVNNDYFDVTYTVTIDGVTTTITVVYEFMVDAGTFTHTAGRTVLDVTGATTATSVAVIAAAQIAVDFAASLSVAVPTTATFTPTAKLVGARFTVTATEHVADAGFTIGTATIGTEVINKKIPRLPAGVTKITCVTTTAPGDWACAVGTTSSAVSDA